MKTKFLSVLLLIACTTSLFAQITREQADAIVFEHLQKEVTEPYLLYVHVNAPSEAGIDLTTSNAENMKIKYACWAYYLNEHPGVSEPTQHRYLFVKENDGNLLEVITYNDKGPANLLTQWKIINPSEDATLNTLSVSEGELEPAFQSDIYKYTVNVANNIEEITITATPNNSNAIVTGSGSFPLDVGENIFSVNVTAEDGVTKLEYQIAVNRMVGIDEITEGDIIVFPNPTTGELKIENGELKIENVGIYDIYGRKCHASRVTCYENIDISGLSAGIYFMKITTKTGIITKKVIKK